MRRFATLILLVAFAACAGGQARLVPQSVAPAARFAPLKPWPATWLTFHYSARHTGLSAIETPYKAHPVAPVWTFKMKGAFGESVAIGAGGLIYAPSSDGRLYCLNADGSLRWKFDSASPLTTAVTLSKSGAWIYAAGGKKVYALDAGGKLQWTFTAGLAIIGTPTLSNDQQTLYVPSFDHQLYALDAATGKKRWAFLTGDGIDATPSVGPDGTIYIGSYDGNFYALASNGTMKWKYATGFLVESTAAIEAGKNGNILVGNDLGLVFDFTPAGALVGEIVVGAPIYASIALGRDGYGTFFGKKSVLYHTLYVADWGGNLHKYYYEDTTAGVVYGTKLLLELQAWELQTPLSLFSSPAISADGHVYLAGSDRNYYELDDTTGQALEQYPMSAPSDASPAIGYDGTVYVGDQNGDVYAFR